MASNQTAQDAYERVLAAKMGYRATLPSSAFLDAFITNLYDLIADARVAQQQVWERDARAELEREEQESEGQTSPYSCP